MWRRALGDPYITDPYTCTGPPIRIAITCVWARDRIFVRVRNHASRVQERVTERVRAGGRGEGEFFRQGMYDTSIRGRFARSGELVINIRVRGGNFANSGCEYSATNWRACARVYVCGCEFLLLLIPRGGPFFIDIPGLSDHSRRQIPTELLRCVSEDGVSILMEARRRR